METATLPEEGNRYFTRKWKQVVYLKGKHVIYLRRKQVLYVNMERGNLPGNGNM
jgi:hypothetical protein